MPQILRVLLSLDDADQQPIAICEADDGQHLIITTRERRLALDITTLRLMLEDNGELLPPEPSEE
jgi:hypothetical protein